MLRYIDSRFWRGRACRAGGAELKIVLTGGTGLIGTHLAHSLGAAGAGHELALLTRDPGRAPDGAQAVAWLPLQEPAPAEALSGADAVIHLAGEPIAAGRWTAERRERIEASRWTGTANLVRGLQAAAPRPRVLLAGSAVGYYGDRGDEPLAEDAAPGAGYLAEVVRRWEREAAAAEKLGMRVVYLRTGVVLAREGGALPRMAAPFRMGAGGRLGNGRQWMPWVHVADVAGLIGQALADESLRGPLNLAAPGAATNAELTRALGRALRRPAFMVVPRLALRLLFGGMSDTLLASQRVVPAAAEQAGYRFRFPRLEEALADLL